MEPNHLFRLPSLHILQADNLATSTGVAAASGHPEIPPPTMTTKKNKQQLRHDFLMRR